MSASAGAWPTPCSRTKTALSTRKGRRTGGCHDAGQKQPIRRLALRAEGGGAAIDIVPYNPPIAWKIKATRPGGRKRAPGISPSGPFHGLSRIWGGEPAGIPPEGLRTSRTGPVSAGRFRLSRLQPENAPDSPKRVRKSSSACTWSRENRFTRPSCTATSRILAKCSWSPCGSTPA